MGIKNIQANQSLSTDEACFKKTSGAGEGEENVFEEFFSSLFQQNGDGVDKSSNGRCLGKQTQNTTTDKLSGDNTSTLQQLKDISLEINNLALLQGGIQGTTCNIEGPIERGLVRNTVLKESTETLTTVETGLTLEKLSRDILDTLEQMQQMGTDIGKQESYITLMSDVNAQDNNEILSFLKQRSSASSINEKGNNSSTEANYLSKKNESIISAASDIKAVLLDEETDEQAVNSQTQYHKFSWSKETDNQAANSHMQYDKFSWSKEIQANTDNNNIASFKETAIGIGNDIMEAAPSPDNSTSLPNNYELARENILNIAKGFKTLRLPDSTELSVKLTPEELGEVTIKVVLEKGRIAGHITAESKEVATLLQNNLDNLKQEMALKNVSLSNISVSVFTGQGDREGRQSAREFLDKHGRKSGNTHDAIEEIAITNNEDETNSLNIIA